MTMELSTMTMLMSQQRLGGNGFFKDKHPLTEKMFEITESNI